MVNLTELLDQVRQQEGYHRAKALADADYQFIADLVALRRERGLSQQDVAARLGISQQAVSRLERFGADSTLPKIRMYANAVGALVAHGVVADDGQLAQEWVTLMLRVPAALVADAGALAPGAVNIDAPGGFDYHLAA